MRIVLLVILFTLTTNCSTVEQKRRPLTVQGLLEAYRKPEMEGHYYWKMSNFVAAETAPFCDYFKACFSYLDPMPANGGAVAFTVSSSDILRPLSAGEISALETEHKAAVAALQEVDQAVIHVIAEMARAYWYNRELREIDSAEAQRIAQSFSSFFEKRGLKMVKVRNEGATYVRALPTGEIAFNEKALKDYHRADMFHFVLAHERAHVVFGDHRRGAVSPEDQTFYDVFGREIKIPLKRAEQYLAEAKERELSSCVSDKQSDLQWEGSGGIGIPTDWWSEKERCRSIEDVDKQYECEREVQRKQEEEERSREEEIRRQAEQYCQDAWNERSAEKNEAYYSEYVNYREEMQPLIDKYYDDLDQGRLTVFASEDEQKADLGAVDILSYMDDPLSKIQAGICRGTSFREVGLLKQRRSTIRGYLKKVYDLEMRC